MATVMAELQILLKILRHHDVAVISIKDCINNRAAVRRYIQSGRKGLLNRENCFVFAGS